MILLAPVLPQWVEWIGFAAATCTTAAFVPQLIRIVRLRSAQDISLPTFLLFSVGVGLWLVYGLYSESSPIVVSNAVTLALSLSILAFKFRYNRNADKDLEP